MPGRMDGSGSGSGRGNGLGRTGKGRGGNGGGGFGSGGYCVCAKCGMRVPHARGEKCTTFKCPDCNKTMIREELLESKRNGGAQ